MSLTQALIVAMAFLLNIGCTNVVEDSPQSKITTKRDNDRIEVQIENGKAVISIHRPFGISHAIVERLDENWPDAAVLRLHLKGLESLKVTNEKITLNAAVLSHDVRLWKDGNEDSPLNSKIPYWMEIRMVGNGGKTVKTIPLNDGDFETELPKVFLEGNPKTFTVDWINFYRN